MTREEVVKKIVGAIRTKRKAVSDFLNKHGQPVKRTDSDVSLGQKLSAVLASANKDTLNEFATIIESKSNVVGTLAIADTLAGLFQSSQQKQMAEQQGQDAITLALINAGIQKDKGPGTVAIIAIALLAIVLIIIGILLYKKYKR